MIHHININNNSSFHFIWRYFGTWSSLLSVFSGISFFGLSLLVSFCSCLLINNFLFRPFLALIGTMFPWTFSTQFACGSHSRTSPLFSISKYGTNCLSIYLRIGGVKDIYYISLIFQTILAFIIWISTITSSSSLNPFPD